MFVEAVSDARFVVSKGDLLIAMSGATTGKMGIYSKDYPAMLNQRVGNVKVISESVLLPRYRDLYFSSMAPQILKDAYGGAQPNISAKDICEYDLLLPPISEQNRIIHEVTRYLRLIEIVERDANNLEDSISRTKSLLLQMAISGKLVPQDPTDEPAIELLKRINPAFKPCDNPHYPFEIPSSWVFASGKDIFQPMKSVKPTSEKFCYIDIDSVDNKNNIITSPKMIRIENAPSRASRFTKKGDVIFSMVRPYLRNIAMVQYDNCIASTGFYVCSPTQSLCSDYLLLMMLSNYVVDGLNQYMKGDNSPSINTNNILSWKYPIPPLNEQKRIVTEVQRLYSYLNEVEFILAT